MSVFCFPSIGSPDRYLRSNHTPVIEANAIDFQCLSRGCGIAGRDGPRGACL
jgi:hypothetical protein